MDSSTSCTLPSFESHGGRLEPFDDGHIPETFRFQHRTRAVCEDAGGDTKDDECTENNATNDDISIPRIVRYGCQLMSESIPSTGPLPLSPPSTEASVHIYDGVLDPQHARMLYEITAASTPSEQAKSQSECESNCKSESLDLKAESPWGTYVTIEEALAWIDWNKSTCHYGEESSGKEPFGRNDKIERPGKNNCSNTKEMSFIPTAMQQPATFEHGECDEYEIYLTGWKKKIIMFHKWRMQNQGSTQYTSNRNEFDRLPDKNKDETCTKEQTMQEESYKMLQTDNEKNYSFQYFQDADNIRHILAVEAVATFFLENIPFQPGTTAVVTPSSIDADPSNPNNSPASSHGTTNAPNKKLYEPTEILQQAHGVAVWALASNPGNAVQYHIDYAELLRYEYNVTVPPLWAGTLQCSALWNDQMLASSLDDNDFDKYPQRQQQKITSKHHNHPCHNDERNVMEGGEFCVNLRGLDHYAEHGYKGNMSGDPMGGWKKSNGTHPDSGCGVHMNDSTQWVTIPYAFNRGIVHKGDMPHLSTPIERIDSNVSRVIVGFNVFGHDVGALVAKAPEHSRQFRRKVRLYRATMSACAFNGEEKSKLSDTTDSSTGDAGIDCVSTKKAQNPITTKSGKGGMDLSQIRKNKALTKLLVLAKREKVKEELRQNQEHLTRNIWLKMLRHYREYATNSQSSISNKRLLRVMDLVQEFGHFNDTKDGKWPKSVDVHVHVHYSLLSHEREAINAGDGQFSKDSHYFHDIDGISGVPGAWYIIVARTTPSTSSDANCIHPSENDHLISLSTELYIVQCTARDVH